MNVGLGRSQGRAVRGRHGHGLPIKQARQTSNKYPQSPPFLLALSKGGISISKPPICAMPPPPHPSSHLLTGGTNEWLKLNLRQLGCPLDLIGLLNGSNGHNSGPRMRGNVGRPCRMRSEESQMFHQAVLVNAAAECFLRDLLP